MMVIAKYITGTQIRMARTALNYGVRELATASGVHMNTITNIEGGKSVTTKTIEKIAATLMEKGITFTADGGVIPPGTPSAA